MKARIALLVAAMSMGLVTPSFATLIGYWPADGSADDASGNGYNGTLQNGATFAPGKVGQAFSFDGSTAKVLLSGNPPSGLSNFSYAAWVNPLDGDSNLFSRSVGAVTGGLYRWVRHPQYTAFSVMGLGLPLEPIPEGAHGHHQPVPFNPDLYKLLLTEARLFSTGTVTGADIVKRTYAREPLLVVKINRASGEILGLDTPPPHVR